MEFHKRGLPPRGRRTIFCIRLTKYKHFRNSQFKSIKHTQEICLFFNNSIRVTEQPLHTLTKYQYFPKSHFKRVKNICFLNNSTINYVLELVSSALHLACISVLLNPTNFLKDTKSGQIEFWCSGSNSAFRDTKSATFARGIFQSFQLRNSFLIQ